MKFVGLLLFPRIPWDFFTSSLKNLSKFGPSANFYKVTEVLRFHKFESVTNSHASLGAARLSFWEDVLPSHIYIDGFSFPRISYIEPVLQCRKCCRFGQKFSVKPPSKSMTQRVVSLIISLCLSPMLGEEKFLKNSTLLIPSGILRAMKLLPNLDLP